MSYRQKSAYGHCLVPFSFVYSGCFVSIRKYRTSQGRAWAVALLLLDCKQADPAT